MIAEIFLYGFFSAFGWWTANHYVIEPHFPPAIEKKTEENKKQQLCSEWKEQNQSDGTIHRTRTCEKVSP